MNTDNKNISEVNNLDSATASIVVETVNEFTQKKKLILNHEDSQEIISIEENSDNTFGDIELSEISNNGDRKKTVISPQENKEVYDKFFTMIEEIIKK